MSDETKRRQFENLFYVIDVLLGETEPQRRDEIVLTLLRELEVGGPVLNNLSQSFQHKLPPRTPREKAVFALVAAALADCLDLRKTPPLRRLYAGPRWIQLLTKSKLLVQKVIFALPKSLLFELSRLFHECKERLQTVGNLKQNKYRRATAVKILRPYGSMDHAVTRGLPRIAIVVPSYNQGQYIEATLESLFSQRYPNLAVHVQDGSSNDCTVEVLCRYRDLYPDRFSFVSEPDSGQADAVNRGFGLIRGDIMGWLNSDDLSLPGSLFAIAQEFARNPSLDVLYGDRLLVDEGTNIVGRWCLPPHSDSDLFDAFWIPQETMFWRQSAWLSSGGMVRASLRFALDWDLALRFVGAGCKFKHIPFFLGALRVYPAQKSQELMDTVGLREMDLVRLINESCYLVPRNCRQHRLGVRRFMIRQKIASARVLLVTQIFGLLGRGCATWCGLEVVSLMRCGCKEFSVRNNCSEAVDSSCSATGRSDWH